MARLQLEHLCKRFGAERPAVQDVSLDIAHGELMVFVGPSGCGKSTTLRLIAGLDDASSGAIRIADVDVTGTPAAQRGVAMVFQSYALYPHMTVAQNMGFALKMAGRPAQEIAQAVGRAAQILRLTPLLERLPKALSGGQRQRVAIGRAIVRNPQVFLFDEPLSNLDASLRHEMRDELLALHRQLGSTMVYVTHDQVEAMTLGQRIAVFKDGQVQQCADPLTLYRKPVNQFVAGFMGSSPMNFAPVRFEGGQPFLGRHAAPPTHLPPASTLGATVLGIRAEHLRLSNSASTLPARISRIERLGGSQVLRLEMDLGGTESMEWSVSLSGDAPQAVVGEHVGLSWEQHHPHLFDAQGLSIAQELAA